MITTTLAHLMDAQPALERLANERLPVKAAYALSKLLRLARPEIQGFTDQRNNLIREFGAERKTSDDERAATGHDSVFEVTAANRETYFAKVRELAAIEVRFEVEPIAVTGLDGVSISAGELLTLEPFVKA
jgi:hypothetical protein